MEICIGSQLFGREVPASVGNLNSRTRGPPGFDNKLAAGHKARGSMFGAFGTETFGTAKPLKVEDMDAETRVWRQGLASCVSVADFSLITPKGGRVMVVLFNAAEMQAGPIPWFKIISNHQDEVVPVSGSTVQVRLSRKRHKPNLPLLEILYLLLLAQKTVLVGSFGCNEGERERETERERERKR